MTVFTVGRWVSAVWALTAAMVLGGCDLSALASVEDQRRSLWREGRPVEYSFILDSGCGERSLIGRFAVTVRSNRVADVEALDESARSVLERGWPGIVPTLDALLRELDDARRAGADVADAEFDPDDGHVTAVDLDYDADATDDEACYRISGYTPDDVG